MLANDQTSEHLKRGALGVRHMVFFVVAAAAPLAVVVSVTPYAFANGNGAGVPLTFILVGCLYALFAVGYTAMSARMGNAVSFYPYVSRGLGMRTGVGGSFASLAAYISVELMATSLFGIYFSDSMEQLTGIQIPWLVSCLFLHLVVAASGARNIVFSGRMLGILMMAEIALLTLLSAAILIAGGGPAGITLHGFGFSSLSSSGPAGNLGVALVFIVSAFIGFEATAIFGEEARDPQRTVPKATYIAVALIAGFYALCTWTISLDYGPSNIVKAASADFTNLFANSIDSHLGGFFVVVLQILLITSLFACVLSFHNTVNRYLWVMGRGLIISPKLGRTHHRHQSPHVAGTVQLGIVAALLITVTILELDPTQVVGWFSAFAAVGILIIQILVSMSVVRFFQSDPHGLSAWKRLIAPILSAVLLFGCLVLVVSHIDIVSGTENAVVKAFPFVIIGLIVAGFAYATVIKNRSPGRYEQMKTVLATGTVDDGSEDVLEGQR